MRMIFTECFSKEEANEIGLFIIAKGYEGIANDSYRYCREAINCAFRSNLRHYIDHIYVGVIYDRMVVAQTKRGLRRNGLTFIEKKRKFKELLDKC